MYKRQVWAGVLPSRAHVSSRSTSRTASSRKLLSLIHIYSSREIKRITPIKDKVLALDEEYSKLTDEELKAKTPYFKAVSYTHLDVYKRQS